MAGHITWVRARHNRIPNIQICWFAGGVEDLDALGYIAYEGLDDHFGDEQRTGYWRFALVFANVLVVQHGFQWVVRDDPEGDRFLLRHAKLPNPVDPVDLARASWEMNPRACPDFEALYERLRAQVRE